MIALLQHLLSVPLFARGDSTTEYVTASPGVLVTMLGGLPITTITIETFFIFFRKNQNGIAGNQFQHDVLDHSPLSRTGSPEFSLAPFRHSYWVSASAYPSPWHISDFVIKCSGPSALEHGGQKD